MKKLLTFLGIWSILSFSGFLYGQDSDANQSKIKTQWIKLYSEENWTDTDSKLITVDSNGFFVIGFSSFRKAESSYDFRLWIWKFDLQGNRIWDKPIIVPDVNENNIIIWDSLFVCPKNELMIIIKGTKHQTGTSKTKENIWLLKLNKEGDVSFSKELSIGKYSCVLRNIAKIKDGYLISGQKLGDNTPDAWTMKIDFNGNTLWEKFYDKGKSEDAISMAAVEDGSFTLAANSGEYNKFGGGPSNIWIIKCDSAGNILTETSFPGRLPTIATTSNGHYAVCYNTADFPTLEAYVVGLDRELHKTWEPILLFKGGGLGMYKIETDSKNNFIILGSKFTEGLCLWKIDRNGKLLWSHLVGTKNSIVVAELLLIKDNEFLLAGPAHPGKPMPKDENNQRKKDVQWDISDILIAKVIEDSSN
jgi:hypothetical protein